MEIKDKIIKDNSKYPKKILQFGQGNFLRGFVDWIIDLSNDEEILKSSVIIAKATERGDLNRFKKQNFKYTLAMRGLEGGEAKEEYKIITSISDMINPYNDKDFKSYEEVIKSEELSIVISNTTEAGIVYEKVNFEDNYPKTFPAKITKLLYTRYLHFKGDKSKGLLFIPVELIDNNGRELKKIVLKHIEDWKLPDEFKNWVEENNKFLNTLVDRIVTGYPKDNISKLEEKIGYKDEIIVTSEIFNLWVIEGNKEDEKNFPINRTKANIIWTDNVKSYKTRKVRILNGAHTSMALAAYLSGFKIVRDMMEDRNFNNFYDFIIEDEIIPTIEMDKDELLSFSNSVKDRFKNPFIDHSLLDIFLNSVSKFKERCLSSLLDYYNKYDKIPKGLAFSLASLIRFYKVKEKNNVFFGKDFNNNNYEVKDDINILKLFEKFWQEDNNYNLVKNILSNEEIWGVNLLEVDGLFEEILNNLNNFEEIGIRKTLEKIV
ncbi:tagaturonate reductase [Miniphocaeibacter halophilus]|uniref:Tagaturonate reductase n=1 Tax=Miniphocaeibacter halophilus TaxID=2931922 RepID=A0AC61MSG9_9FIRM|nr:tagaturonate reductase [Miniphocaeibacter halophilus]QQK07784.1 tagaturonate reductase [Miniphocaeibacter halophilus]